MDLRFSRLQPLYFFRGISIVNGPIPSHIYSQPPSNISFSQPTPLPHKPVPAPLKPNEARFETTDPRILDKGLLYSRASPRMTNVSVLIRRHLEAMLWVKGILGGTQQIHDQCLR